LDENRGEQAAKTCTKCGKVKPLNEFGRDRHKSDGLTTACRECRASQIREQRAADPEKARAAVRQWRSDNLEKSRRSGRASVRRWRAANRETDRENSRNWYRSNPERARARNRATRAAMRRKVFDHYGWSCACCGSTENLTIDHVNGGGKQHRDEIGNEAIYRWLVQNNFPSGFQTLCSPCNRSKFNTPACRLDHETEVA
jgi:hypothetical protein